MNFECKEHDFDARLEHRSGSWNYDIDTDLKERKKLSLQNFIKTFFCFNFIIYYILFIIYFILLILCALKIYFYNEKLN